LRLVSEYEKVVENLLGQRFVAEQRPRRIGYNELVGFFAVADGIFVVIVVFNQTDDLEFELGAVDGLDDQYVTQFDLLRIFRLFVRLMLILRSGGTSASVRVGRLTPILRSGGTSASVRVGFPIACVDDTLLRTQKPGYLR
jgi:hypothetical protein